MTSAQARSPGHWLERIDPRVHIVWRGRWAPGTVEPARVLADHELVVFTEGVCLVEVEGATFRCPPGRFLVVPPGMRHVTYAGDSPVFRSCVHFDWTWRPGPCPERPWAFPPASFSRRQLRRAPDFVPKGVLEGRFAPSSPVSDLLQALEFRWRTGLERDRLSCRALLLEILLHLFLPEAASRSVHAATRGGELAFAAKAALDRMRPGEESVTDVLGSLGASYEHVCRLFKRRFGLSPLKYLTGSRMEKAKWLLREGGNKIAWVGSRVGYSDPGYFARAFRKYSGMSPSEYALAHSRAH